LFILFIYLFIYYWGMKQLKMYDVYNVIYIISTHSCKLLSNTGPGAHRKWKVCIDTWPKNRKCLC